MGDFKTNAAAPLKSLILGRNHPKAIGRPTHFRGYYKYTPGPVMTGPDGNEIPGRTDEKSMYAVIFRAPKKPKEGDVIHLDGETVLTSERIVGRAEWKANGEGLIECEAINGFTEFSIPFKYTQPIDYDTYDYRVTIVCSSSKEGDLYIGAVGSSLIVDDLEIVCEPIK